MKDEKNKKWTLAMGFRRYEVLKGKRANRGRISGVSKTESLIVREIFNNTIDVMTTVLQNDEDTDEITNSFNFF